MNTKSFSIICLALFLCCSGCSEDDPVPPFNVNFSSSQAGISGSNPSVVVSVIFSRAAGQEGSVDFEISPGSLVYGENNDFYTSPAAQGNILTIPFQAGAESISFTVNQGTGLNIQEDESVAFDLLQDASGLYQPGQNTRITVDFSENFIAPDGILELNAGGEEFSLKAYLDFSKLAQTTIDKYSWDLGFYTGESFAVILNSSAGTMARSIDKTDLTQVTPSDTAGWENIMTIPPPGFDPSFGSVAWIDSPDGDLSKTAFGEISPDESANKVFIIRREDDQAWKKVRVLRNGEGYILHHANLDASTFETLQIDKNTDFNFMFADLDQGLVEVEPPKSSWDIMYGTYTEILNLGPSGSIPYGFKDFITINRHQTEAALIMESTVTYDSFTANDLARIEWKSEVDAIGENWRLGGGPTSSPSIQDDRFFVLKDSDNIIYKIKFTRLTAPDGERGYPELIFERVQ